MSYIDIGAGIVSALIFLAGGLSLTYMINWLWNEWRER